MQCSNDDDDTPLHQRLQVRVDLAAAVGARAVHGGVERLRQPRKLLGVLMPQQLQLALQVLRADCGRTDATEGKKAVYIIYYKKYI